MLTNNPYKKHQHEYCNCSHRNNYPNSQKQYSLIKQTIQKLKYQIEQNQKCINNYTNRYNYNKNYTNRSPMAFYTQPDQLQQQMATKYYNKNYNWKSGIYQAAEGAIGRVNYSGERVQYNIPEPRIYDTQFQSRYRIDPQQNLAQIKPYLFSRTLQSQPTPISNLQFFDDTIGQQSKKSEIHQLNIHNDKKRFINDSFVKFSNNLNVIHQQNSEFTPKKSLSILKKVQPSTTATKTVTFLRPQNYHNSNKTQLLYEQFKQQSKKPQQKTNLISYIRNIYSKTNKLTPPKRTSSRSPTRKKSKLSSHQKEIYERLHHSNTKLPCERCQKHNHFKPQRKAKINFKQSQLIERNLSQNELNQLVNKLQFNGIPRYMWQKVVLDYITKKWLTK